MTREGRNMKRITTAWRLAAIVGASTLLAVACGGSDDSEGAPATEAPAASEAPAESSAPAASEAPAGDVDRTGQTIKIGYVNNDALSASFRIGGQVAIDWINANGGIHGATIEVVECNADGSPEGSINCANKMIEENVAMAYTGLDVGSDAAIPIYSSAGIPYVTSNGWGPVQENDPIATILHAASGSYFLNPLSYFKDQGILKTGTFFTDNPAGQAYQPIIQEYSEKLGMETISQIVDSNTPDFTTAIAALQSQGVEAIWGIMTEPNCIGFVTAARQLGFTGPVFAGSCSFYINLLKELAVGTLTQGDLYVYDAYDDAPAEIQARLDEYAKAMTDSGNEAEIVGFAQPVFGAWMELRTILESIPGDQEITAESILAAINSGTVFPGWFGPDLQCGAKLWPDATQACHATNAVYEVVQRDDGTMGRKLVGDFKDASSMLG